VDSRRMIPSQTRTIHQLRTKDRNDGFNKTGAPEKQLAVGSWHLALSC
jgi:hypothetical protein